MAKSKNNVSPDPFIAAVLAWLVPGAGHWYLGQRARGLTFFVAITFAFWTGLAIGGARSTVDPQGNTLWFLAEAACGGYTVAALLIGKIGGALPSYSKTLDLATIYAGVAGLLNLLVVLDALGRSAGLIPEKGKAPPS